MLLFNLFQIEQAVFKVLQPKLSLYYQKYKISQFSMNISLLDRRILPLESSKN
jgi:hypothetical protein